MIEFINWKYSPDIKIKMIEHEENTLELYSKSITEKYQDIFESYGCTLDIGLGWNGVNKYSKERLPFTPTYSCILFGLAGRFHD